MAHTPRITFKAGRCDLLGKRVTPDSQAGFLYIYLEDELPHFCWRPRNLPSSEPFLDLIIPPGDVTFEPLVREEGAEELHSPTNGRIFVLRFASSGERHFFYLQSKSQHRDGDPSWFSERDQYLGQVVNSILQGEDVDIENEITNLRAQGRGGDNDDMELDEPESGTGGAGQGATGGDPRQEGELSREGGEDGGRASNPPQTSALVQDFLRSIKGSTMPQPQLRNEQYTTLQDLLTSEETIPVVRNASAADIDLLCSFLPADLFLLAQESASSFEQSIDSSSVDASAAIAALSTEQKQDILLRVLRTAQIQQSLGSLTIALRDGGLPMIGEALQLDVEHGGLLRGGSMPLGGGDAVRGFVEGVRRTVEKEEDESKTTQHDAMEE